MNYLLVTVTALACGSVVGLSPLPAQAQPRHEDGIAFVSDRDSPSPEAPDDDVYVSSPVGGRVSRMTTGGGAERYPTLSPDGSRLAFVSIPVDASGALLLDQTSVDVCRVRDRGRVYSCGRERRVAGPVSAQSIAWTADSRSLLYSGVPTAEGDVDLYVVDTRSGTTRNLTQEPVDQTAVQNNQPSVARSGSWVYYAHGDPRVATGGDLYRRPLRPGRPAEQLTAAPFNDNGVDVSSDGRRLVFHANRDADGDGAADDFDVWTMRAAPESADNPAVDLTEGLRAADGRPSEERRPSWSPDGRRISFMSFTDPVGGFCFGCTDGKVFTMREDGSDVYDVTDDVPAPGAGPVTPLFADITPDWGRLGRVR